MERKDKGRRKNFVYLDGVVDCSVASCEAWHGKICLRRREICKWVAPLRPFRAEMRGSTLRKTPDSPFTALTFVPRYIFP